MSRSVPQFVNYLLDTVFGLPGIAVLGLLVSVGTGLFIAWMNTAKVPNAEIAASADDLRLPVLGTEHPARWLFR